VQLLKHLADLRSEKAAFGRYCCKSGKSNDAENLAKADF